MSRAKQSNGRMPRRRFLEISATGVGAVGGAGAYAAGQTPAPAGREAAKPLPRNARATAVDTRSVYTGDRLSRVAFPMGGFGAGMICLEGTGTLSHFSLRNRPDVFNEPCVFAAVGIKGSPAAARVLEGPVPGWKLFGQPGAGNGTRGTSYGLPRFRTASFRFQFPFGTVALRDARVPLTVEITGWSPFTPGDPDSSSLPVAALEYRFANVSKQAIEAVFSFNARNFLAAERGRVGSVRPAPGGFALRGGAGDGKSSEEALFAATVGDHEVRVNLAWFRGGWFDPLTVAWKEIAEAACFERPAVTEGTPSPGASLFVPFKLEPGASRTLALRLAWFAGESGLRLGKDPAGAPADPAAASTYRPWYAGRFSGIDEVAVHWSRHYDELRNQSEKFRAAFYDTTLPAEVIEAVAANLTILKSPTVLRQTDGRLWSWEGCNDSAGCCAGSCTHVWNYAQALPHLFPGLERSLRETEFGPSQDETGHQTFRSALPIRIVAHDFYAAADGQLGGIMKAHRDWRVSGDTEWLRRLWPKIRRSLDYCIETWDPGRKGWLEEPHHNTYDIEFWGPDGMCTSFYLGALSAAVSMGKALGENVAPYSDLLERGTRAAETELYDGEYFIQKIEWKNLRARNPLDAPSLGGAYSSEARELLAREGPKYQYGGGCLSDGVLGSWMALVCGVGQVLDPAKVRSHLRAVHRHNLKRDLSQHSNPQRPSYACGSEGGLLLCSWPKGGKPTLPFVYSDEVWTGIEYQVASHLIMMGLVKEGLEVVRTCRNRYDGRVRNPFNEYECGHWYARAMSSYALLQALSGARYDGVDKVLHLNPRIQGDFRCFLATAAGYGIVGVRAGKPFWEPKSGSVEVKEIRYTPAPA